jgi:hypothetical protein
VIIDACDFEQLANRLSAVLVANARLPTKVFRPAFVQYRFIDVDSFSGAEFWSLLKFLAAMSSDDSIGVIAVEPDPLYYYHHFGQYGAANLTAAMDFRAYQNILSLGPDDSPADALEHASVLTWLPPSLKWAVWRERAPEMMLLAYADTFHPPLDGEIHQKTGLYMLNAGDALELASPAWRDRRVYDVFARELLNNYAPGESPAWQDTSVAKALEVARQLMTGEIDVIQGARTLSALRFELGDDLADIFSTFTLIDSETDHLPIGEVRQYWAAEALIHKTPRLPKASGFTKTWREVQQRSLSHGSPHLNKILQHRLFPGLNSRERTRVLVPTSGRAAIVLASDHFQHRRPCEH